jgi:hypothetical protein
VSASAVNDPVARPVRHDRGPRGRLWLYAVAFAMLLVSAYLQFQGNLYTRLVLVWSSIGLSCAVVAVAALAVAKPGRRLRPVKVDPALRRRRITTGNGSEPGASTATTADPAAAGSPGDGPAAGGVDQGTKP